MSVTQPQPTLQVYPDAAAFLAVMQQRLLAAEERCGLMLGIALTVRDQPYSYGDTPPYFATVTDVQGIAAALITPPFGVVLEGDDATSDAALAAITVDLAARQWSLPTAIGPDPIPARFAKLWAAQTDVHAEVGVRERAFVLRQVIPPRATAGSMRVATADDTALVQQWYVEFGIEALGGIEVRNDAETRRHAARAVEQGKIYLWEDDSSVSMAGVARPTPNGISIGPVYTPPHLRGQGYASALVAALSQHLLDQGRQFITLFTDLSNPTSNRIYQAVGYEPVCDFTLYRFITE